MASKNGAAPIPIAPSASADVNASPPDAAGRARARAVSSSDIVFVNGQAFNGRGYRVCGVANQRGTLCGRIGTCPFHAGKTPGPSTSGRVPKRRRVNTTEPVPSAVPAAAASAPTGPLPNLPPLESNAGNATLPDCVRRMDAPPTKSRFKRSWTPAEHRQFLISMKKYGKGKWKEISREVKSRTANQCQSHAQKYFLRQAKSDSERKKKSIHDVTEIEDLPPLPPVQPDVVTSIPELPKVEMSPLPLPLSSLPSPPPPIQSPSVYFSANPPPFSLGQDNHPGASNVNALASVALATASGSDAARDMERSKSITAVVNAALKNASPISLPNTAASEGTTNVNSSDGATSGSDSAKNITAVMSAALKTANQISLPNASISEGLANPNGSNGANTNGAMMSALQAPFSQLMSNPQALMLLNPLLATMGGLAGSNGSAMVGSTVAPATRLRVTVHENGRKGGGMALVLPESNELEDFFKVAKDVLAFVGKFKRVFTRSGGEITSLDQMVQDDALWLSQGEEFATPL